jgi:ribonuclease P/MRP protein subunit RPP40
LPEYTKFLADHLKKLEYLTTVWFVDQIEKWFYLMTSRSPANALSKFNLEIYNETVGFLNNTYFSKAFDTLGHEILVRKLKTLGWSSNFVNFLYSYQSGRKQFVSVHGHRSNVLDCSSGVPQRSMLGPPLFSIFINDIIEDLSVSCLLYADDMKIFTSIREVGDCVRLQDNIDLIPTWCIRNSLQLNIAKCVVMTLSNKKQKIEFDYNINGVVLVRPELVSDLGVLFDNKLFLQATSTLL